ncbi:methyl-accepting chemotaxis protein [Oikeobacillus pervagus]|uniref:Methyl-accepting chemotaxis protein n=1 Tax=Oikeobacillus pervagus TaxID=1325931 RepID=A0AAJ1T1D4_9BACI|nr:methyl-accepting chemotaxis protein [Oikeobacillus pervagus]MDQ0215397.1 methyl-accepting chemotaxis protein [Oikeobacillus pervagus]
MRSIKFKLIIPITILLMVSFGIIIFFTNWKMEKIMETDVMEQIDGIVKEANHSTQVFLEKHETSLLMLSESDELIQFARGVQDKVDHEELSLLDRSVQKSFNRYTKHYKDVASVYFVSPTNRLKAAPVSQFPSDYHFTEQKWYKEAKKQSKTAVWSEPYIHKATKTSVITISKAVYSGEQFLGVIAADINLTSLTNWMNDLNIGYHGFPILISKTGVAIVHDEKQGKNIKNLPYIMELFQHSNKSGIIQFDQYNESNKLVFDTVKNTNWKVGAIYHQKELQKVSQSIQDFLLVVALTVLLLIIIAIILLSAKITKPLGKLTESIQMVTKGHLNIQVDIHSKDEVGQLAHHFNYMMTNMKNIIKVMNITAKNVRESVGRLQEIVEMTKDSTEQTAAAVQSISEGATDSAQMSDKADQQFHDLGNRINHISVKTDQMSSLLQKADQTSDKGFQQMSLLKKSNENSSEVVDHMQEVMIHLNDKVETIEVVVQTITQIASQTNLLALNASIEAARAGEHGKGFAVVADEVRKLAEQSSEATKKITTIIQNIQMSTKHAVEQMSKTKNSFHQQTDVVKQTNSSFQEISEFIHQIKQSISAVNVEVQEVTGKKDEMLEVVKEVAYISQEAAAASQEVHSYTENQLNSTTVVSEAMRDLTELSIQLQKEINQFKTS